jgi:hypothetical protein
MLLSIFYNAIRKWRKVDMREMLAVGQRVIIPRWTSTMPKAGAKPTQHGTIIGAGCRDNWYRVINSRGEIYQVHENLIKTVED